MAAFYEKFEFSFCFCRRPSSEISQFFFSKKWEEIILNKKFFVIKRKLTQLWFTYDVMNDVNSASLAPSCYPPYSPFGPFALSACVRYLNVKNKQWFALHYQYLLHTMVAQREKRWWKNLTRARTSAVAVDVGWTESIFCEIWPKICSILLIWAFWRAKRQESHCIFILFNENLRKIRHFCLELAKSRPFASK